MPRVLQAYSRWWLLGFVLFLSLFSIYPIFHVISNLWNNIWSFHVSQKVKNIFYGKLAMKQFRWKQIWLARRQIPLDATCDYVRSANQGQRQHCMHCGRVHLVRQFGRHNEFQKLHQSNTSTFLDLAWFAMEKSIKIYLDSFAIIACALWQRRNALRVNNRIPIESLPVSVK